MFTPPSKSGRPATNRCVSVPMPIRNMLQIVFGVWALDFWAFGLLALDLGLWVLVFGFLAFSLGFSVFVIFKSEISDLTPKTKVPRPKSKALRRKLQHSLSQHKIL